MDILGKKKGMGVTSERARPLVKESNNDLLASISDDDDAIYEMKLRFNHILQMVSQPQMYYKQDFEKEAKR